MNQIAAFKNSCYTSKIQNVYKFELVGFEVYFRKKRVRDCKSNAGALYKEKNVCDKITHPPIFNLEYVKWYAISCSYLSTTIITCSF
jgi:hypothetical protein